MTGELVQRPVDGADSLDLADQRFDMEKREAIARFLEVPAEDPALIPYLAICARYGLDPVMGQVWLIPQKVKGRNGKPDREIMRPSIGRDGLLAVARRTPEYQGLQAAIVCARDEFSVEYTGDFEKDPVIRHKTAAKPTEWPPPVPEGETAPAPDDPGSWRGPILGAWAKVYLKGKTPVYYYAPLKEHGKVGTNRSTGEKYWMSAWTYTSAMILKAAQSTALRIAVGVTGVVPSDELRAEPDAPEAPTQEDAPRLAADAVSKVADAEWREGLTDELSAAVYRVNELEPFAWSPAKVRMRLAERTEEEAEAALRELRARIQELEASEEEEVVEAEVYVYAGDLQPGQTIKLGEEWHQLEDVAPDKEAVTLVLSEDDVREVEADAQFLTK